MIDHNLRVSRKYLGRKATGGRSYGTVGRCSCGERFKVNVAPSKGGEKKVNQMFDQHREDAMSDQPEPDHPAMIDYDWLDLCEREERGEFDDVIYGVDADGVPLTPDAA